MSLRWFALSLDLTDDILRHYVHMEGFNGFCFGEY